MLQHFLPENEEGIRDLQRLGWWGVWGGAVWVLPGLRIPRFGF